MYQNLVVSAQTNPNITIPDAFTIECHDSRVFVTILDALACKKKITFAQGIRDLTVEDLNITEQTYFGSGHYLHQLRSIAMRYFATIPQYTYFRFQYLNNIFASKGIYITGPEKEQEYIKIIEKDDPELLKYLEEFLQIINQLNQQEKIYQAFLNAQEKMMYETAEDTLKAMLDEAVNFFDSESKRFVTKDERGYFSTVDGKYKEQIQTPQPTQTEQNQTNGESK